MKLPDFGKSNRSLDSSSGMVSPSPIDPAAWTSQVVRDPSTSLSPSTSSGDNLEAFFGKRVSSLGKKASSSPQRTALASPPSMTAIPEAEVVDWDAEIETFLASVGSSRSSSMGQRRTRAQLRPFSDTEDPGLVVPAGPTGPTPPDWQVTWASRRAFSARHGRLPARDSTTSCTVEMMNCTSMMLSVRDPDSNLISRIDHVSHLKDLSVLDPLPEEPYTTTTSPAGGIYPHSLDQVSACPDLLTGSGRGSDSDTVAGTGPSRIPSRSPLGGRYSSSDSYPLRTLP